MAHPLILVLLIFCLALPGRVGAAVAGHSAPTQPVVIIKPVYQPPLRGAPDRRKGGGTRGGTVDLSVLAPRQSAWVSKEHPRLFWFLSAIPEQGKLSFAIHQADSSTALYETSLPMPKNPGIHGFQLKAFKLKPGVEYLWSIILETGLGDKAAYQVTQGGILFKALPRQIVPRWNTGKEEQLPAIQAHSGYWYDALETLAKLIEQHPKDKIYRQWRTDLLHQVELDNIGD